jgi:hypothetical protein
MGDLKYLKGKYHTKGMLNAQSGRVVQISTYVPEEDAEWINSHFLKKSVLLRSLLQDYIRKEKEKEKA